MYSSRHRVVKFNSNRLDHSSVVIACNSWHPRSSQSERRATNSTATAITLRSTSKYLRRNFEAPTTMATSNMHCAATLADQLAESKIEPHDDYHVARLLPRIMPRVEQAPDQAQQETAEQPAAKPKKKRIRRQKLELEYLRGLVVQLEEKMTQLKTNQLPEEATTVSVPVVHSPLIWKGIAERQCKERARSEEKNKNLRASLEGQLRLAMKLEGLLRKRPRDEELGMPDVKRLKALPSMAVSPTDDEVFADQLQHVQSAHLVVDELFSGREFVDLTASFSDLNVISDPSTGTGVAFVKKASALLPFDVEVAGKAFWRSLAEEGTKKDNYFLEDRLTAESIAARSYGMYFTAGNVCANVRGKQTFRKFVADERIVIMWKWVVEPIEVNGKNFRGLKCHESGWIVLRGVNTDNASTELALQHVASSSTTSTHLQSYSKMTMELQEGIADQELKVGTLTEFVVNLHDTINEACGKMVTDLLVEEDWKRNGWI